MKVEFKVDGGDYIIPEKITINQYQLIQGKQDIMGMDKSLFILSVLSGCPIDTLRRIKSSDSAELFRYANKLFLDSDTKFYQTLELDGSKFGFIPKMNDITLGEFLDLDLFVTEGSIKNLHKIMAVLYRPLIFGDDVLGKFRWEIEEYEQTTFEDRAEFFKGLPVHYAMSASSFFFHLGMESIKLIQDSLVSQKKMTLQEIQTLEKLQQLGMMMDQGLMNTGDGMQS